MGDKGGARLIYGKKFEFCDGSTLDLTTPDYEIPGMYLREDMAFIEAINSGIKDRNNIENILESAKLLDYLYKSADAKKEIRF